ncbi:MAG: ribosome small subunit-dependent GTPase A [Spirochaetaceae bacterium]|jgi:ribosome biogenesis GTPase|nr:ribosome small subunit-dependent GTPase A [Spirochaetaceae bacterium]
MINLYEYGFTEAEEKAAGAYPAHLLPGRIIEVQRGRYCAVTPAGEVSAELRGSFAHALEQGADFPAVGDFVMLAHNPRGASLISALLPRRTRFSRANFGGHSEGYAKNVREEVTAANFDVVFIVMSINRDFNLSRAARYLTAVRQSGAAPVFLLSKADLAGAAGKAEELRAIAGAVPVISVSSKTGAGLPGLAPYLAPAKTVVFLGSSGVGKSSLLNALMGETVMTVKAIRENDSRGRHTTTHRQLFRLPSGALIIDTPGMRALALWDAEKGADAAFAGAAEIASRCKFSDCTHGNEPGCAVRAALADGSLSAEEWKHWEAHRRETAFIEDHAAYLRKKREFFRNISRRMRRNGGGEDW